jgi:Ni,Fe-hydrogenase I large subunit
LGHWLRIEKGIIAHYQIITPTGWNGSPRDAAGQPGPMEKALLDVPVKDPNQPIEVLRVIHSFDPCLACAVHVVKPVSRNRVRQLNITAREEAISR